MEKKVKLLYFLSPIFDPLKLITENKLRAKENHKMEFIFDATESDQKIECYTLENQLLRQNAIFSVSESTAKPKSQQKEKKPP